jgi:uncharacterized membrane protein
MERYFWYDMGPLVQLRFSCILRKHAPDNQISTRRLKRGDGMAAETNVTGIARLLYIVTGIATVSWGLWGADQGWTQWTWLALGGALLVLGLIGYSPIHAWLAKNAQKAS